MVHFKLHFKDEIDARDSRDSKKAESVEFHMLQERQPNIQYDEKLID